MSDPTDSDDSEMIIIPSLDSTPLFPEELPPAKRTKLSPSPPSPQIVDIVRSDTADNQEQPERDEEDHDDDRLSDISSMSQVFQLLRSTKKPVSQSQPTGGQVKPRPMFLSQGNKEHVSTARNDASVRTLRSGEIQQILKVFTAPRALLHRSSLARKSTYFVDLFERKLFGADIQKLNEYPVLEVEGNAKDFAFLLDVIDDDLTYLNQRPSFDTIARVLRTAAEFQFLSFHSVTPIPRPYSTETVVLARDYDVPNVLKGAMYELVRTKGFGMVEDGADSTDSDEDDTSDSDEIMASDREDTPHEGNDDGEEMEDDSTKVGQTLRSTPKFRLSRSDIAKLVHVREHLVGRWFALARSAPPLSPACLGEVASDCSSAWEDAIYKSRLLLQHMHDPIIGLWVLSGSSLYAPKDSVISRTTDGHWHIVRSEGAKRRI
ncbi:hypothetical protein EW145_g3697 [Phellinidium pouzarii]|uniref:BTB domain-containing protein n=1 Tax=Phellinidium pouzarii TaxID=167371 RepID=A0A4S4L6N6_9AGAM|nr:hypothetical protein EW145_g3697 [Phellinidium pouzarii]